MLQILQVAALVATACAMSFALAHAAEMPGKLRLDQQAYETTQTIYYPGFTIGAISEPLAILLTLALAIIRRDEPAFSFTAAAFCGLAAMHAIYWFATHPVNQYWLKDQKLSDAGGRFFAFGASERAPSSTANWIEMRNRWEYSHVARAGLALLALTLLAIAITS